MPSAILRTTLEFTRNLICSAVVLGSFITSAHAASESKTPNKPTSKVSGLNGAGSSRKVALQGAAIAKGKAGSRTAIAAEARLRIAAMPLAFEKNQGQTDGRVQFLSRGAGYTFFLTPGDAVLTLAGEGTTAEEIHMKLAGSLAAAKVSGEQPLSGTTNYLIGNDKSKWKTGITDYAKVRYRSVYPGIDVLYYGNQTQLEHDFLVAPGADPGRIALTIDGAQHIRVDATSGDLVLKTREGELRLLKPAIYQQISGKRVQVAGGYKLSRKNRVTFALGAYDRGQQLVIDPVVNYATYLSAASSTTATAIAVDATGKLYVTGTTTSAGFPAPAPTATNLGAAGGTDVYVAKIDPTANATAQLIYTTFIGGSGADTANAIALDASNDAVIAGQTTCQAISASNWPTVKAFQSTCTSGKPLSYATELGPTGASILYSTLYGGSTSSSASGVAVNGGIIFFTGATSDTDLPVSSGAFSNALSAGGTDAYVAAVDTNSAAVTNAACNGAGNVTLTFAAADPFLLGENIVISGVTSGLGNTYNGTFPIATIGANSITYSDVAGCTTLENAASAGSVAGSLEYGSYLGGAGGVSSSAAIAVTGPTAVYIAGKTASAAFPATGLAVQTALSGTQDAFVAFFNITQSGAASLVAATYLGGTGADEANAIALDTGGRVYVAGDTTSINFPGITGPQGVNKGGEDAFIARLAFNLSAINAADYLGGANTDTATSLAVDSTTGVLWLGGSTNSTTDFNVNGLQSSFSGTQDGFIAKYDTGITALQFATWVGSGNDSINSVAVSANNQVAVAGTVTTAGMGTPSAYQTATVSTPSALVGVVSSTTATLSAPLGITGAQTNSTIYTDSGTNTQTTQYTWTVKNNDAVQTATNVSLELQIPGGASSPTVTFTGVTPTGFTCSSGPGGLTCSAPTLAPTASASVVLTVSLAAPCTAASCPDIVANGKAESAENGSKNSASITTHQVPVTTLSLTHTAASDVTVTRFVQDTDSQIDYQYVVNNAGTNPIANVRLAMTFDAATGVGSTVDSTGSAVCGTVGTTMTCTIPLLAAGANWTFNAIVNPNATYATASRILANSVTVDSAAPSFFDINAASNAGLLTPFTQERDTILSLALVNNGPKPLGGTFTFTDTFGNTGKSNSPTAQAIATIDAALTGVVNGPLSFDVASGGTSNSIGTVGQVITADVNPLARLTGSANFTATAASPADIFLPVNVAVVGTPGAQRTTNVVTITTTAPHGFNVGDQVFLAGVTGGSTNFNGTFTVASVPSATTFTYAQTAANDTAGSGTVRGAASSLVTTNTASLDTNPTGEVVNNAALPLSATSTATVQRQAALSLGAFTANPTGTVQLSNPLTYAQSIVNAGPNDAINLVVRYTLTTGTAISTDAAITGVTGFDYCVANPNTGTTQTIDCTLNSLTFVTGTKPTSVSFTPPVTANFATANSDTLAVASALTSVSTVDQTTGDDAQSAPSITVQRQADLDISAAGTGVTFSSTTSSGVATVPLAGNITYHYSIKNAVGSDTATNVLSSIALTPGSAITGAPSVTGTSAGTSCVYNAAGPSLDCTTATIAANTTSAITVTISVPITSTLATNSSDTLNAGVALGAQVTTFDTTAGNNTNTGTAANTLQRQADLDVTGTFSATPTINLNGSMAYTFTVANAGPDAAINATVRLALATAAAPNTIANALTITGQPTGATCSLNGNNIDCLLPAVALGGGTAYTVTLTPPTPTSMTGASALPNDTLHANAAQVLPATAYVDLVNTNDANANTLSTTLNRQSDLQLTFTGANFSASPANPTPVSLAGPLTYTLIVKNAGPDTALNIDAKLTLATGAVTTAYQLGTVTGASCAATTSSQMDCTFAALASGATQTLTIPVTPPLTAAMNTGSPSDTMTTSALAFSNSVVDDGTSGAAGPNNSAPSSIVTTIERIADPSITSFTAAGSSSGNTNYVENVDTFTTYTSQIANAGPDAATGLTVTVNVPSGFTIGSVLTGGVTCNSTSATTYSCTGLPTVASGGSTSLVFRGTPPPLATTSPSNTFPVTVTVGSTQLLDSNGTNNSGSLNITDARDSDVSVAIAAHGATSGAVDDQANKFIDGVDTYIHYSALISNAGPSIATATQFTLNVPPGSVLSGVIPANCTQSAAGNPVVCTAAALPSIAVGGSATLDFFLAPSALPTTIAQQTLNAAASSTGGYTDPNAANNTNIAVTVSQERDADVSIGAITAVGNNSGLSNTFVDTQDTALTLTIPVANAAGASPATNISVFVTVPSGTVVASGAPVACSLSSATTVTCANVIASLASSGSTNVTLPLTPPALGTNATQPYFIAVSASGAYVDTTPANNTSISGPSITVERETDLALTGLTPSITIARVSNVVARTQPVAFTIGVQNHGPSAAQNINVTDVLPANFTFTATGSSAGCSASGQTVTCTVNALAVAASTSVTIVGVPNLSTSVANAFINDSASVSSTQSVESSTTLADNFASTTSPVELRGDSDVTVTVTPSPAATVDVGAALTYTVTLSNAGPWPSSGVAVETHLPFSGMTATAPGFSCAGTICTLLSPLGVGSGSAVSLSYSGTVPASAVSGLSTSLAAPAWVTSYGALPPSTNATNAANIYDPDNSGNAASASVNGLAAADLQLAQSSNGPVLFGNTATYSFTVTNNAGLSPALNPKVVSTLTFTPANSVTSITPSTGACTASAITSGTATVTCNLAQIASGAQATFSFNLNPALPGQITNSAAVTDGTEPDPTPGNNNASALTLTVDNTPAGTSVQVTPTHAATGVQFTPNTATFASVSVQGTTTLDALTSGNTPFNYRDGSLPRYYMVATTATYSGALQLCINYAGATYIKPERIRLYAAGTLDITTSLDQATTTVCGQLPSGQTLGSSGVQLAVVEPVEHLPVASATVITNSTSGTGKGGITGTSVIIDASASTDPDSDPCFVNGVATTCRDVDELSFTFGTAGGTDFKDVNPHFTDCNPASPVDDPVTNSCSSISGPVAVGVTSIPVTVCDQVGGCSQTSVSVSVSGLSFAPSNTAVTVSAGQGAKFDLGNFTNSSASSFTFTVTGTPGLSANEITCTAPTIAAGQSADLAVLCSTQAPIFAMSAPSPLPTQGNTVSAGMIATTLFPVAGIVLLVPGKSRRARRAKLLLLIGFVLALTVMVSSCGGSQNGGSFGGAPKVQNAGTPKGTYLITVTPQGPGATTTLPQLTLTIQ